MRYPREANWGSWTARGLAAGLTLLVAVACVESPPERLPPAGPSAAVLDRLGWGDQTVPGEWVWALRERPGQADLATNARMGKVCPPVTFPVAEEPDGCSRVLLTRTPEGTPFGVSSRDVRISRDGSLAVFTVSAWGSQVAPGLPEDKNEVDDIYAMDLDTMKLEVVSLGDDGAPRYRRSHQPSVSADGRFVAFTSFTGASAPFSWEGPSMIFVRDREQQITIRASVPYGSRTLTNSSNAPVISGSGRYVVFQSADPGLVPFDRNGRVDLFLRDLQHQTTVRLSLSDLGYEVPMDSGPAAGISDDGRFVLFEHSGRLNSILLGHPKVKAPTVVYLRDRATGKNLAISRAPDGFVSAQAEAVALSPDGKRVLFRTTGLHRFVPNVMPTAEPGTLLAQVREGRLTYELVAIGDGVAKGMSVDARQVVFTDDLVGRDGLSAGEGPVLQRRTRALHGWVMDRAARSLERVTANEDGRPAVLAPSALYDPPSADFLDLAISGDGRSVVFTTVQFGLVDDQQRYCVRPPPAHVYLRRCP